MRNYDTKVFLSLAKQLETLFSYFRIFPSFAKRSKLDETVTCFVQFRISLNKKKDETVNPSREESDFQIIMRTGSDTYKQVLKHEGEKAGLTIATFDLL